MELRKPKLKKGSSNVPEKVLPTENDNLIGVFNGLHVTIKDDKCMNCIYDKGNFGKGNFSKSGPRHKKNNNSDDIPELIFRHQFENEAKWFKKETVPGPSHRSDMTDSNRLCQESLSKFLTSVYSNQHENLWKSWKEENSIPNSLIHTNRNTSNRKNRNCLKLFEFSEDDNPQRDENFIRFVDDRTKGQVIATPSEPVSEKVIVLDCDPNCTSADFSTERIHARLETRPFPMMETLDLNLEEAFFLSFDLNSLKILDIENRELSTAELWQKFSSAQANFPDRYVTYHYYRTKGWIVKSGLKYGGDYLLYKDGADCNHASYLVKIVGAQENLNWLEFLAANRLVETTNKDVLFVTVVSRGQRQSGVDETFPECLKRYSVQEVMSRRWFATKERLQKTDSD